MLLRTHILELDINGVVDVTEPRLNLVYALTPTTVVVTFSEEMLNDADLVDAANYYIDNAGVSVFSAQRFGNFSVRLLTSEMLEGESYTLTASNVSDRNGNPLDTNYDTKSFIGLGGEPELSSVLILSSRKVRLHFNESMRRNSALTNLLNYAIVPLGGGTPVNVGAITPENITQPTYVDLAVTEMTNGANYRVIVANVQDVPGNIIGAANFVDIVGVGEAPVILRLEGIGENRVDIVFDEDVLDNAFARDAANYVWTGGLVTISVLDVVGERIKLVVSDQTPGSLYELTIG